MQVLLAAAPVLVIVGLMVGPGWSAARAGLAGVAVAAPVAVAVTGGQEGAGLLLAGAAAEAAFSAATILWIIFPALCIFELLRRQGAFEALRGALGGLTADPRLLALLVAWFVALFLEGAAGFGTPVALAAPILVSLGFSPMRALTVVLVGHAAGVSFGAVGTPVFAQVAITGFSAGDIALRTAVLHALPGMLLAVLAARLAVGTGVPMAAGSYLWAAGAGVLFLVPFLLIAIYAGPELPTLGGALIGGAGFVLALRLARRAEGKRASPGSAPRALMRGAVPYAGLLLLVGLTRLVPEIQDAARGLSWSWTLAGEFSGTFQPLYHPGTLLFAAFVVGGLVTGAGRDDLASAMSAVARRLGVVTLALLAMLSVARLMVHGGMIDTLAFAAASAAGPFWPLAAPLTGALGSFVTGSATASNILFTDFQGTAAATAGMAPLWGVAAQGFGAAVGNILCPHNVIAGAATVGLVGREGEVLRRTLPVGIGYALAGGAILALLIETGAAS